MAQQGCPCCGGESQAFFSHRGHYLGTDDFAGCRIKCMECGIETPTLHARSDKEAENLAREVWERRETCRNLNPPFEDSFTCSECGTYIPYHDDYGGFDIIGEVNYCPGCGKEVMDE